MQLTSVYIHLISHASRTCSCLLTLITAMVPVKDVLQGQIDELLKGRVFRSNKSRLH